MRLRQREIEIISRHVSDSLLDRDFVQTDDPENLCADIARVIHDELRLEDDLNEEVRSILEQHSGEISRSNVEYHSMFNLVKRKLVRERGLIL